MMFFKRNKKAQTANILNLIVAIVLIIAAALPVTLEQFIRKNKCKDMLLTMLPYQARQRQLLIWCPFS